MEEEKRRKVRETEEMIIIRMRRYERFIYVERREMRRD